MYSAMFLLAVMSSFIVITTCQMCGTKAYGGAPRVEFYATKPEQPQDMKRYFNTVAVRSGSRVTLVCTAKEPQGFPWFSKSSLQPYMINWFLQLNASTFTHVSNCDSKPHKVKTCVLSLTNIKPRDNGKYFCRAANSLPMCTYKQLQLTVIDDQ